MATLYNPLHDNNNYPGPVWLAGLLDYRESQASPKQTVIPIKFGREHAKMLAKNLHAAAKVAETQEQLAPWSESSEQECARRLASCGEQVFDLLSRLADRENDDNPLILDARDILMEIDPPTDEAE